MQGVPGSPDGLADLDTIDERLGEGAEVAVLQAGLALGHAGNHVIGLLFQPLIAGGGIHHGASGKKVPDEMSADLALGLFPPAQRLGRRRQPGVDAKVVQQAIDVQRQQVVAVEILGVEERAGQQPDVRKRKRLHGAVDLHGHRLVAGGRGTLWATRASEAATAGRINSCKGFLIVRHLCNVAGG